jgi:anti-sigma B factor antagonist
VQDNHPISTTVPELRASEPPRHLDGAPQGGMQPAQPGTIPPDAYSIRVQRLGGCYIARLAGRIDTTNASNVQHDLCELVELGHVAVDMSGVTSVDSATLTAFTAAHRRADERGTSIHLAGARRLDSKIAEIRYLRTQLDYHDDIADAAQRPPSSRPATGAPKRAQCR